MQTLAGNRDAAVSDKAVATGEPTKPAEAPIPSRARSRLSINSLFSLGCISSICSFFSIGSLFSSGSVLSIGGTGSVLSIGSSGSLLSIGSTGSILSIGAKGGILRVGGRGRRGRRRMLFRRRANLLQQRRNTRMALPIAIRALRVIAR